MASPRQIWLLFILPGFVLSSFSASCQASISVIRKLFESRNFAAAKTHLSTIKEDNKEYPEALYLLGRIAVEERKYELSIEKFEAAIAADSRVAEYHNWLGVMYGVIAMNSNPLKQAYYAPKIKNQFEEAARLDPTNLQTQWGLINYYTKAPGFLGGSWEKALSCAGTISRHDRIQGLRAYGFVHAAQGQSTIAEKELSEALHAEPANWDNTFAIAQFYCDQKKFDRAIALYEAYLKQHPLNMVSAFHLGAASARSGFEIDRGISCLTYYLTYTPRPNEPTHSDAHMNLGLLYEKKGQLDLAKKSFQTSVTLEPGLKEAKEGLSRLN